MTNPEKAAKAEGGRTPSWAPREDTGSGGSIRRLWGDGVPGAVSGRGVGRFPGVLEGPSSTHLLLQPGRPGTEAWVSETGRTRCVDVRARSGSAAWSR